MVSPSFGSMTEPISTTLIPLPTATTESSTTVSNAAHPSSTARTKLNPDSPKPALARAGVVAGGVVGGIAALVLLVLLILLYCCRHKRKMDLLSSAETKRT